MSCQFSILLEFFSYHHSSTTHFRIFALEKDPPSLVPDFLVVFASLLRKSQLYYRYLALVAPLLETTTDTFRVRRRR